MSIISLQMDFPGQADVVPRIGRLNTDDPIDNLTDVGYLNDYVLKNNIALFNSDIIQGAAIFNSISGPVPKSLFYSVSVAANGEITMAVI